jgi:hypothetical protein
MFKKLLIVFLFTLTLSFNFNTNVEALVITELQTFNVGFTPLRSFENDPDDPDGPPLKEGNNVMLESSCITIPGNALTLTVQPTTQFRDIFGLEYESSDGYFTEIRYFINANCTTQLFNNITDANEIFKINDPSGVLASKTYVFDLNVPFKGFDINNPIQVRSFKMVYATRIPFANLVPFYYTSGTTPSSELININVGTRFSFETPNRVDFVNNGTVISKYFMNKLPQQPTPTKTFHTFLYYADIEGKRVSNRGYYNPELLQNRVLTLTAVFEKDFTTGQPTTAWTPPAVNNPIGQILFNTGYYNITGFVFIYTLLILGASILLWKYGMPTFVSLIANILITAVFMFFGYLPFFVSIIMILLFLLLIIGINKGGLFSE